MIELLKNDWKDALSQEFEKPYFQALTKCLEHEYTTRTIFPAKDYIFNALNYTPLSQVKILILGQDPYHDDNQAHGLCFSVPLGQKIPPSLQNIYKELHDDIGCPIPNHGYLKKWADQGVLLLNTVLTVRAHEANSHKDMGWEQFTDAIIKLINEQDHPLVILLWGKPAQKKKVLLNHTKHLILESPHPSPLSSYRGFWGSKPFSQANAFLKSNNRVEIDWTIDSVPF